MNHLKRKCKFCKEVLTGRIDKMFCSEYCRSAYHYQINKEKEESFYKRVDKQLKLNRRIMKNYNKAGKATVRRELLLEDGFNPKYFTHYWKNGRGHVYLFCYEFGFFSMKENDQPKYLLVRWQTYMDQ